MVLIEFWLYIPLCIFREVLKMNFYSFILIFPMEAFIANVAHFEQLRENSIDITFNQ